MQTVLDTNFHFYWIIHIGIRTQCVNYQLQFLHEIAETTNDRYAQKVSQSDIRARVTLEWLFNVRELERIHRVVCQLTGFRQFLDKTRELMVISTIVVKLNLTYKLHFDTLMLQFARFLQTYVYLRKTKVNIFSSIFEVFLKNSRNKIFDYTIKSNFHFLFRL